MVSWTTFEENAPALAALCYQRFKATDLVMLGTLRKDGFPRISPVEWAMYGGELTLGGMWHAKKALDLVRDPRCTIHSTTANKNGLEGDAKLWGRATELTPAGLEDYRQWVYDQSGHRPRLPFHVFTIDIESAAYVTFAGGAMKRLQWPGDGDWIVAKG